MNRIVYLYLIFCIIAFFCFSISCVNPETGRAALTDDQAKTLFEEKVPDALEKIPVEDWTDTKEEAERRSRLNAADEAVREFNHGNESDNPGNFAAPDAGGAPPVVCPGGHVN